MADNGYINEFRVFNSVQDFLDTCDKESEDFRKEQTADTWHGNQSWKEVYNLSRTGDLSAVQEANAILEQVDGSMASNGIREQWTTAPAGAFPNVPAFLANAPETMYARQNTRGQKKAVNIYYVPAVSSGVDHKEIFKRGVTVLALAMQLSRMCEVNLYFCSCYGKNGDHVIKLASPMVLSESAHVLTSTGFLRSLSFGYAHSKGWAGSWASWHKSSDNNHNIKEIKTRLKLTDDDIVIPPMHNDQFKNGDFHNPVKYINGMLEKYKS